MYFQEKSLLREIRKKLKMYIPPRNSYNFKVRYRDTFSKFNLVLNNVKVVK